MDRSDGYDCEIMASQLQIRLVDCVQVVIVPNLLIIFGTIIVSVGAATVTLCMKRISTQCPVVLCKYGNFQNITHYFGT